MKPRKKTERKLIAGSKHKRVPCFLCGEPIWVANSLPQWLARCTECGGYGGLHGVGRDNQTEKTEEE